jgi:hypothetical protein
MEAADAAAVETAQAEMEAAVPAVAAALANLEERQVDSWGVAASVASTVVARVAEETAMEVEATDAGAKAEELEVVATETAALVAAAKAVATKAAGKARVAAGKVAVAVAEVAQAKAAAVGTALATRAVATVAAELAMGAEE